MRDFVSKIIFDDVYRTLFLGSISILFSFLGADYKKEKYCLLYSSFLLILILPFLIIMLSGIAFTNFDHEVMREILAWSFHWIAYFMIMFIVQHILIAYAKRRSSVLNIISCILLFMISLSISFKLILPQNTL